VTLGSALVHFFAPKHHPRALQLLDGVLKQNPKATACLLGKGYVFLGEGRYSEAREQFELALEIEKSKHLAVDQAMSNVELEATECVGWSMIKEGRLEEGRSKLMEVVDVLDKDDSRNQDSARVWTRIGQAEWEMQGKSTSDMSCVQSLQSPLHRRSSDRSA
jgi:superkiller protein 3